jgi:beta-glucanase (GH16 family)
MMIFVRHTQANPPSESTWGLIFADEFSGTTLDTMKWNYNYPWGATHNHDAYMLPQNVTLSSGILTESAYNQSYGGKPYTSGAINSNGRFNYKYGYYEANIKTSSTQGAWPAFWMLQNDLLPPEIDIMQAPVYTSDNLPVTSYNVALLYGSDWQHVHGKRLDDNPDLSAGFHTYGVDWEAGYMKFYFDGNQKFTTTDTTNIAQCQQMYMIIDLAVVGWPGDPPAGATWPITYQVDWVRAWEKTTSFPSSVAWTKTSSGSWDDATAWSTGSVPLLNTQTATFGSVSAGAITVDWTNSRTAGGLIFNSSTNYTLGSSNGSLMLDKDNDADTAWIDATSASGASPNIIDARLDLHSNVTIRSPNKPLTINGEITGPGALRIESGQITLNGAASYNGATTVTGGALIMNGAVVSLGSASITGGSLQINSMSATMHDITGSGALIVGQGSTAAMLSADYIAVGTLTLAPGSRVTINPIPGGPLSSTLQPVPEPSTWSLLLLTAAGALLIGHRRK